MIDEPISAIIVGAIAAVGGIIVALLNRSGKKIGKDANPAAPAVEDAGDHAHTRDVVKAGIKRLEKHIDGHMTKLQHRFDVIEVARGTERQQGQVEASRERVITPDPKPKR